MNGRFTFDISQKARSFSSLLAITVLVGVFAVSASPAFAQTRETDNRLNRLEKEIDTLSRAVYKGDRPPSVVGGPSASAATEIRLQQIEREMRELRGTFEEQMHNIRMLRKELERVTSDLELRVNDLEGKGASVSAGDSNGGAPYVVKPAAPAVGGGNEGYNWNSGAAKPVAPAPKPLGSYVKKPNGVQAAGVDSAAATYENAFAMIKASKYDAAEREFTAFLNSYPDHVLAGNAKYWLGETYYVRGNFENAARIFAEGYQKHPEGAKAADNLLKLGMSLAGLGKTEDACIALGQLDKTKLAGAGPVMRRAEQEKSRLGC
jgi:tol-pal system protein YbgF